MRIVVESTLEPPPGTISLVLTGDDGEFTRKALAFLKSDNGKKFLRENVLGGLAKAIEKPLEHKVRLQAMIPSTLDVRFKDIAKRLNAKRSDLLTEKLSSVFNMRSGRRLKQSRDDTRARQFENQEALLKHARLLKRAPTKTKYSYVCKTKASADAITNWASGKGVSVA